MAIAVVGGIGIIPIPMGGIILFLDRMGVVVVVEQ